MKKFLGCFAVLMALGAFAPKAEAQSVVSNFFTNQNRLSDNSADWLFNRAGGNTTIDVGDVFLTTFAVDTLENPGGGGGSRSFLAGSGRNEFTGFAAIQVTGFVAGVDGNTYTAFGPVDAAARAQVAAGVPLGGVAAGTMPVLSALLLSMDPKSMIVLMDDGPTHDYERAFAGAFAGAGPDDSPAAPNTVPGDIGIGPFAKEDLIGTSIVNGGGVKIVEFGFTGLDPDEFWVSLAGTAIPQDAAFLAGKSGNFGTVNMGLNVTKNQAGLNYGLVTKDNPSTGTTRLFNFGGNANLEGVGLGTVDFENTPYDSFDDFNGNFRIVAQQVVPEPGSIALFAMGICGFGVLRRRLRSGKTEPSVVC